MYKVIEIAVYTAITLGLMAFGWATCFVGLGVLGVL